jgi:hypothetical protein
MSIRPLTSMLTALLISGCAIAQPAKPDEDHSAHHPPGGAPAAASAQPAQAGAPSTPGYEQQMKAMQEMRLKLQAAKTPAERAALMNKHMKLMQAGMSMMGGMDGMDGMDGMGMMNMHTQMERRTAMMEQIMQMMVDREAARPSK